MKISMSLRLCNEEGEKIFGKGVAQLLRLIDKEGSLNAAAKRWESHTAKPGRYSTMQRNSLGLNW